MAKLICLFFLLCATPAWADSAYRAWLAAMEDEAIQSGISPDTVHAALDGVTPNERVIELDQQQPEHTMTFDRYVHHVATPERIRLGRKLFEENEEELRAVARRTGVPPQVIVALWGIESSFGHASGDFDIIESLATLAFQGRRADFFRAELISALRILDQEHMQASDLRGSWAGAMGQCQFMPSTYLRYAVDGDGDGKRDIWDSQSDVWASIGTYLAAEGWNAELTWGREVELEKDAPDSEVGLEHQRPLAEWTAMGVRSVDGSPLPDRALQASLIQPDGPDGRSFLVYDNFRALMRWNRSTYFATTVGLMADRIKQ